MILSEHVRWYDVLKPYCREPMLMLGNQENFCGYSFGIPYTTLDPDGGDLKWDLNNAVPVKWHSKYNTVCNMGTLEHVWDVHRAFTNAARMVKVGGVYMHAGAPCAGYENHGIHITHWVKVLNFFSLNGFKPYRFWFTEKNGAMCKQPKRNCHKNILFWFWAEKIREVEEFTRPQHEYKDGKVV